MAFRPSPYFNDPGFAQAAASLAQLFAPPSPEQVTAQRVAEANIRESNANRQATEEKARRLAEFHGYLKDPNFDQQTFDRMGIGAGAYNPNQSYYSVDQGNAVARRGQDIGASTSRANNLADNQRSALTELYRPLDPGQVRPELPSEYSSILGLPSAVPETRGAAPQLSESEMTAIIMGDMANQARSPDFDRERFDRMGVAGGVFSPNQSYYSVDQGNAVSRNNNTADNARAMQTNRLDNQRQTITQMYGPLNPGQVRPEVPQELLENLGLSALPETRGAPEQLSETQWNAQQRQRLQQTGALTDQDILDNIMGDVPVETVKTEQGPRIVTRRHAIGQEPYQEPQSERVDNYLAVGPDGQEIRFAGYVGPNGSIYDVNTNQPVPNVVRREGTGGGMSFEADGQGGFRLATGAGQTVSRQTDLQRMEADSARATSELTSIFNTIRRDDVGVEGNLNDFMTNYGAQVFPDLARGDVTGMRNQMRATAVGLARSIVQDERLSDADRRAANAAMVSDGLGESLPGARAKLASLIALSAYRQKFAAGVRTGAPPLPPLDRDTLVQLVDEGLIEGEVAREYDRNVLSRTAPAQPAPAQPPPRPGPQPGGPAPGMVEDGYRFRGGDPADAANWEPVAR